MVTRHWTAKPLRGISSCGGMPTSGPCSAWPCAIKNLRAHQVEPGDDFRDRVLDLDARVHLDEKPFVLVEVVEEFNRAGVVVADFAGHARGGVAQFLDDAFRQAEAGRDFDDLLMPALHRAIAFVQMNHIAVLVAENLHLDVLGARNVFFQKHRRIAERAFSLALRLVQQAAPDRPPCAPRACRARRRRTPP